MSHPERDIKSNHHFINPVQRAIRWGAERTARRFLPAEIRNYERTRKQMNF